MRAPLRALRRADRSRRWCVALGVALALPAALPAVASAARHRAKPIEENGLFGAITAR